ncbi:MAG: FAD-dependent oxidoreductase [Thermotaleaceae bacterium]
MKISYDAVVIGGGIIGLSSAYYLTQAGKRVLLIEKNEIGSGASGACDDMILLQSKKPGISLELAFESLEMYRTLSSELGVNLEFESHGGMILIETEQQLKVMEEFVEQQKKWGLEVEIIDKKMLRKKQPYVKESVIASTYSRKDAQVNPLKVMRGFMGKGRNLGLETRKKTTITGIEQKKDYWKIILEDGSQLETEYIVNAAGAWAGEIGRLVDIDIPIVPKRGQIAVTEQIPQVGDTNVWSAAYIAAKLKPGMIDDVSMDYKKLGIGFAFTQSSNGNYLIGSTREEAGYDKGTTLKAINLMVKQASEYFPILKNVHIIRCFAGLRPAAIDGKAIIGEVQEKKGFYIAAGHEGDGIALAPVTGKMIAQMIMGTKTSFDVEGLNLMRFRPEREVNIL